jgi:cytidylate kinase
MIVITIDGPSGTGKTTVAKLVAERLEFAYFDTGAMYRALTWSILQRKISLLEDRSVQASLDQFDFRILDEKGKKHYFVGKADVTEAIRTPEVTREVSAVAALKLVRDNLLSLQHKFAKDQHAVFEGRDLGTVVFPKAQFKVFLTADSKVRAERRLQEMLTRNPQAAEGLTHEAVLEALMRRDAQDSEREIAPLRCPPEAFIVDTTCLSIEETVRAVVNEYHRRNIQ